jgi:predicted  nucleic acid-binding Zn-ribbon protein
MRNLNLYQHPVLEISSSCSDKLKICQVDKANAEVQRLEAENKEIRAEMQAAKLSAAESTRTQQEAAKREKRVRKKSQTRDRQRQQLQDEIEEAGCMQVQLQKEIDDICKATKEAEVSSKFLFGHSC